MTRVLLGAFNARFTHSNPALYYLREAVRDLPVEVVIRQWTLRESIPDLLTRLHADQPDILALSVHIWSRRHVEDLLADVKKLLPGLVVVLGGPEVTADPEGWEQRFPQADYLVAGAGEAAFRDLAQAGFRWPQRRVEVAPQPFTEVRFPYRDEDFGDDPDTSLRDRYVYYEASRGCPFLCTYCISGGSRVESRPANAVLAELDWLAQRNPRLVKFVDRTFNADPGFARTIWRHLAAMPGETAYHFEVYPALLRDEDFALLASAPPGKFRLEVGVQAIQSHVLAGIRRNETWTVVRNALLRLAGMSNLHLHVDMLVGLREQTTGDLRETFDALEEVGADHLQVGFLKCLPGTPVGADPDLTGSSTPPYPVLRTRWLSHDDIVFWRQVAELHDHLRNPGLFRMTLAGAMRDHARPSEFWCDLARFWMRAGFPSDNDTWLVLAQRLTQYFAASYSDRLPFLLDCLRWDWCGVSSRHYYPPFLDFPGSKALRNEGRTRLESELDAERLARTSFFRPQTREFCRFRGSLFHLAAFAPGEPVRMWE